VTGTIMVTPGRVALIELCRPDHNYLDLELVAELADAVDALAAEDTRAVVLASRGKHFSAGANLGQRSGLSNAGGRHIYDEAVRLFQQPVPIVAAVQGAAIGAGLGLALAADFRVATPRARFAANFAQLGFHPGFGISVSLPRVVGPQAALDLLYTGRRIDGQEALRLGLCDELAPDGELRDAAMARAEAIASSAPLAVRSIRATMRGDLAEHVRTALARERGEQETLMRTQDFREGVAAGLERRKPEFINA
jgi:2-(1,2-epoxy-1,2-dihydrophenyl)acetyl-CoA isomerase